MFELEPIYKLFKDTGTIPKFKMSKGFRKHWPLPNYIFPLNNNCSYEVKILNFESPAKIYVLPVSFIFNFSLTHTLNMYSRSSFTTVEINLSSMK